MNVEDRIMPKVMVFEDNEVMVSLLNTLLQIEGFNVSQPDPGASLEGALDCIRQDEPVLVLLDVHLRHFDGFELLERIRADHQLKEMRVLMSSGMELGDQSRKAGANGFLLKPFMPDDLIRRLKETLGA